MRSNSRGYKLFLLACLYFTQMLPLGFIFPGLTVIMRKAGYSLQDIAYLFVIGAPYMIKFLWAPYIDRGAGKPNHYKRIILIMTVGYAIVAAIASQINPVTNLPVLVALLTVAMGFLSTQDIAVDALTTRILPAKDRGIGNGIQAAGAFCGYLIGGGVIMMLFERIGGWGNAILLLTGLLVSGLIPLFFYKEASGPVQSRVKLNDILSFFKNTTILPTLLVAILSGVFLEVSYRKMRPLLTDAKFKFEDIGFYINIIGMSAGIVSAILFGFLMKKWGIRNGFLASMVFALTAFPALIFPAMHYISGPYILAAVIFGGAASGAMHATVYALYMNNGREGKEGTDFTVQNALAFFVANGSGILFGRLADQQGYTTLFIVTGILHLALVISALFIVKVGKRQDDMPAVMQQEAPIITESEGMVL